MTAIRSGSEIVSIIAVTSFPVVLFMTTILDGAESAACRVGRGSLHQFHCQRTAVRCSCWFAGEATQPPGLFKNRLSDEESTSSNRAGSFQTVKFNADTHGIPLGRLWFNFVPKPATEGGSTDGNPKSIYFFTKSMGFVHLFHVTRCRRAPQSRAEKRRVSVA